jgi:hypothetical protein
LVTIGHNAPFAEAGCREHNHIFPKNGSQIFSAEGLTVESTLDRFAISDFRAGGFAGPKAGWTKRVATSLPDGRIDRAVCQMARCRMTAGAVVRHRGLQSVPQSARCGCKDGGLHTF